MARKTPPPSWQKTYNKYCFNLFRHLSFIAGTMHQELMRQLEENGYRGQNAQFIQVIPYLGSDGVRATDIARQQQIPKQTMAKLVAELCRQKYIVRKPDPDDSRAKRLFIAKRGIALVRDALKIERKIEQSLEEKLGASDFEVFRTMVGLAFDAMDLAYPPVNQHIADSNARKRSSLHIQLHGLTRSIELMIHQQNLDHGFSDLQNAFITILSNISEEGTRIADIVAISGTTKQSVSALANKATESGYILKVADPLDGRSQKLAFSDKGRRLIMNSMGNYLKIEKKLQKQMGKEDFESLQFYTARLWQCLGGRGPDRIETDKTRSGVDVGLVDDWIRALYLALRSEDQVDLDRYFSHGEAGIQLRPQLTQFLLQRPAVSIGKKDEKRVAKWLKDVINSK